MDKITPSREAATVTTAKGMSIGYVPVFILGIITYVPFPPQPLDVSRAHGWGYTLGSSALGPEMPGQRIHSSGWVGQRQVWTWPVLEESKVETKKERERGSWGASCPIMLQA